MKVGKLNIDDSPNIAATYGVSSIPTLMIFKGGDVVDRFVGVQPKKAASGCPRSGKIAVAAGRFLFFRCSLSYLLAIASQPGCASPPLWKASPCDLD